MMDIQHIPVESIAPASAARALDQSTLDALASSITALGLLQPIIVTPRSRIVRGIAQPGFQLIAGNHRLAVFRHLGRTEIPATVVQTETLECELIEIDENLCRAELSAAQRVAHLQRRKVIWEALSPVERVAKWEGGQQVGQNVPPVAVRKHGRAQGKNFAASTAAVTGESKKHINRQLAIAQSLGDDLESVAGTTLDKGTELAALSKMPEPDRKALIRRAKAGEHVSACQRGELVAQPDADKALRAILRDFSRLAKFATPDYVSFVVSELPLDPALPPLVDAFARALRARADCV